LYCCRRHQIAIKVLYVKLYQAVRVAEEVQTLREYATMLRFAYIAYIVRRVYATHSMAVTMCLSVFKSPHSECLLSN
jgi:hypothetical protein